MLASTVAHILVVSANDTGAGKTVLAVAMTRILTRFGPHGFITLKPVCSGGRQDAQEIFEAQGRAHPLDEINPWHFRAELAPPMAARKEGQELFLAEVVDYVRDMNTRHDLVIVDAAGGLLSPLTSDGDTLDLINALDAFPVFVCQNRLGAINQSLLLWKAMPENVASRAHLILMDQQSPGPSAKENTVFLRERLGTETVLTFPFLPDYAKTGPLDSQVGRVIKAIDPRHLK